MSSQQQQHQSDVWPINPSRAFALIVTRAVMEKEDDVASQSPKLLAAPPPSQEKDDDAKEEEQQQQQEEEEASSPAEKLKSRLKTLTELADLPSSGNRRIVELGQVVQLHLELSSVIQQLLHNGNKKKEDNDDENKTGDDATPPPPPAEAFELAEQVKIGAVRWEARLSENRWVPAPKCCKGFPFFDDRKFFHPTADHIGMTLRGMAILSDKTTDRCILIEKKLADGTSGRAPSLIASEEFLVVPTQQQQEHVMNAAQQRGQIGVFAREKVLLEPLAVSEKNTGCDEGEDEGAGEEKGQDSSEHQQQQQQQVELVRSEAGRKFLVACRRVPSPNKDDDGKEESAVEIRICFVGEDPKEDQEKRMQHTVLHEGIWSASTCSSFSPCILSERDEFTLTLFFASAGEQQAEIPVTFPTRAERDTAALGIRSLL